MATYTFSSLNDGQAIAFNPAADLLNFDQQIISAANVLVTVEGTDTRLTLHDSGTANGKSVLLQNTTPLQLATSNVTFANGSALLFGDNSPGTANDNLANTLNGTAGNDLLQGFGGADTLNGGLGNDAYIVGAGDVITDTGGTDTIFTDVSFNVVANIENLTMTGTANINSDGNTLANVITGNAGNNVVWANNADDTVIGGAGNDDLHGEAGNDWIEGGLGNDTIGGGADKDHIAFREYGAANADTVISFASNWDDIQLDAAGFSAIGASGRFAAGDVRFYSASGANAGHDADDRIVYNTSTGQLWYDADGNGSGAAQLIATLGAGTPLIATDINVFGIATPPPPPPPGTNGTAGNDLLTGTDGPDTINGLGGDDTLIGMGADDRLDGGDGNDQLDGRGGNDLEIGGAGNDILGSNNWDHALWDLRDSGSDTLDGGLGDDTFFPLETDTLVDSAGVDTVMVEGRSFTLGAGFENLTFFNRANDNGYTGLVGTGNDLANVIDGMQGADGLVMHGLGGNDTLVGTTYSDTFDGGTGNDTLQNGNSGAADTYLFSAAPGAANADSVTRFAPSLDKIVLDGTVHTNIGASGNFATGDARFYSAAGANAGHDADDRVVYNSTTGQLWYDADGSNSGAAQLIATLQGAPSISAIDIAVVNGSTTPPSGTINGTAGNDTLTGTSGNDTINGFAGNDSILGQEGADSLIGGDGNDTLVGHTAGAFGDDFNNTLDGGMGDDTYVVAWTTTSADTILPDPGGYDTVIVERSTSWTLGSGLDKLQFDVDGGVTGTGNDLDNVILGGFEGSALWGMAGNDLLQGRAFPGSGSDDVHGGDGNDTLSGGGRANHLFGDAGDDVLRSGDADSLTGGAGADTFVLSGPVTGRVIADFSSGADKVHLDATDMAALGTTGNFAAGDARFYAAAGATGGHDADDRVVYDTSTGNLWYDADGSGTTAAQLIATLQGAPALAATDIAVDNGTAPPPPSGNTLNGTAGNDTLVGGSGSDTLNGLDGADSLVGNGGDDSLNGGNGIDTMNGGLGNDTYVVTAGDVLTDAGGTDTVMSDGSWTLGAEFENLTFLGTGNWQAQGNNLANVMIGNTGANYFNSRAGDDTIQAGAGNDSIDISTGGTSTYGAKVIDGGAGFDTIDIDGYARTGITVNLTAGTMSGGGDLGAGSATLSNIERVVGGGFNDRITGDAGANLLEGRAGNDTLAGAGGVDTMVGGAGNDSFVFGESGTANADRLTDFASGTDRLLFDHNAFTTMGAAGNFAAGDARFYAASGATGGHDADDRLVYNSSTGQLYYDDDGSGAHAAQLVATLNSGAALAATDITVI